MRYLIGLPMLLILIIFLSITFFAGDADIKLDSIDIMSNREGRDSWFLNHA